ncbi:hypothetical protein [Hyphomicrobium sp.]|nr:hypothetical protein [Hyphomicrobium sp.]
MRPQLGLAKLDLLDPALKLNDLVLLAGKLRRSPEIAPLASR